MNVDGDVCSLTVLSFRVSFGVLGLGCFCQPCSRSALCKEQVSSARTLPTLSPAIHAYGLAFRKAYQEQMSL